MKKHCTSCHKDAKTFSQSEIEQKLDQIDGWSYDAKRNSIYREFKFKGFARTIGFINAVAWISQRELHHPDISFGYNYATIHYQTHEAKGVTENDFICATQVNLL